MSDRFSIRQSNLKDTQVLGNDQWWTLTTDQEVKKSPRFAFLIISATAHLAHLQSHTSLSHSPSFAKESNFANAQNIILR